MHSADKEVCIESLNHVSFIPLAEGSFPVGISTRPAPVRLPHFPVGAHNLMSRALWVIALELIPELVRNLFQLSGRSSAKERELLQSSAFRLRPFFPVFLDQQAPNLLWLEKS